MSSTAKPAWMVKQEQQKAQDKEMQRHNSDPSNTTRRTLAEHLATKKH